MDVELVTVETGDAVRLDGYLRTARTGGSVLLGVDVVICHHGVGSNFYASSFFAAVGDALVANGTAVLRVNNRGHDHSYTDRTDALWHSVRAWLICVAAPASVP